MDYDFDVFFLVIDRIDVNNSFTCALNRYLTKKNVNSHVIEGSVENDIIYQACKKYGLKRVSLIEINEDVSKKRVSGIAEKISRFISMKNE